ncbi:ABC transporter substrate-binding protein [Streptomyces sp. GC420]|uniref:ABC transporter substrate-binding protein n=1 Tax=Streptomyces sp. GC420 TaxID=2697568 RepID=UPI001414E6B4|nr:ABC transporter substrate-binding protein [Streptomyces sp. GC420]NBM18568.1 ABC transporter substrate-binding protein [Streptomyces sp. GC420]
MSHLTQTPSRDRGRTGRGTRRTIAMSVLLGVLVTAGCSTKATEGDAPAGGSDKLATGPGVTDKTIKLGVLTDQTGVFAGAAKAGNQGRELFWDEKNAEGGVCGRKVEFVVKDHGYQTQQAVSGYAQIKDEVLALDELLGSPMIAALLPTLESDEMLTLAVSWSSTLLDNPYVVISGTTYDIEMINGLQHLVDTKKLGRGDVVSHIYLEGDYGQNALEGSRAAAKKLGLKLKEHKIKPTDTDLTAQVTSSRNAKAKAVLLTTTGAQTASAVSVAEASGYGATFLGSNPSFSPALLSGSAKSALQKQLLFVSSVAPFSSEADRPAKVRKLFNKKFKGEAQSSYVMYGYAQGEIMARILETACENKDLTRKGLFTALKNLSRVDTGGLVAPLDFSNSGQIPARQTYVLKPDARTEGGTKVVKELFTSELGATYKRD